MSIVEEITSRDREFISELRKSVAKDIASCDDLTPARNYEIHREAFDKIIGYVTAYRPLLTSIKAEYEEVIDSLVRGHKEAQSLEMKVEAIAAVQPNLQNYKKRCSELEARIEAIKANNGRLRADIASMTEARRQSAEAARQSETVANKTPRPRSRRRMPPGMTLEDATDASRLSAERSRISRQLQQLQEKARTQYVSLQRKEELTQSLLEKIRKKEEFEQQLQVERLRHQLLALADEAVTAYQQSPPFGETVAAAISRCLRNSWPQRRWRPTAEVATPASTDADPGEARETEKIVEYLEKFQELLAAKDFVAAAYHAANSYRGVLRTIDIFVKFKEFDVSCPGVLLTFCEALLSTASVYEGRLGAELSFECVQEALAKDRVDLVEHWVTKDLLTLTKEMGELVANHGDCKPSQAARSFEIAHSVLNQTEERFRACECLVQADRTDCAVSYGVLEAALTPEQFRRLLQRHPSVRLALSLVAHGCLTLGDVIGTFFVLEAWTELAWLVDSLIQQRAEEQNVMGHQAAMQLMSENPEVPSSVWTEVARRAPEDMRHLNELLSSSVVFDAFNRSLSSLQAAGL